MSSSDLLNGNGNQKTLMEDDSSLNFTTDSSEEILLFNTSRPLPSADESSFFSTVRGDLVTQGDFKANGSEHDEVKLSPMVSFRDVDSHTDFKQLEEDLKLRAIEKRHKNLQSADLEREAAYLERESAYLNRIEALEAERRDLLRFTQSYISKYLDPSAPPYVEPDPSSFLSSSSLSNAPQESVKDKIEFILDKLEEKASENSHLSSLLHETEGMVRNLTAENKKLLLEINRLHEEGKDINQQLAEDYSAKVAKWEQTIKTLAKEKAEKEEEVTLLIEELAQNEIAKMALSDNEIELKNTIHNLKTNYDRVVAANSNYKAEIESLKASLSKNADTMWLKNENAHWKSEYNNIADELNNAKEQYNHIANELSNVKAQLTESSGQNNKLKLELQELYNKMDDSGKESLRLKQYIETLKADNSKLVEDLASKKDSYYSELLDLKRKYTEVSEKNDLLINENHALNNNLNKLLQDTLKTSSNNFINEHKNMMEYFDAVIQSVNGLIYRLNDGDMTGEEDDLELVDEAFDDLPPESDYEQENPAFGLLDENDQLNNSLEAMLFDREHATEYSNKKSRQSQKYQDDPIIKHNDASHNAIKEQQIRKRRLDKKLTQLSELLETQALKIRELQGNNQHMQLEKAKFQATLESLADEKKKMVSVIERYIEDVNQKREELKKLVNENANLRETIISLQNAHHDIPDRYYDTTPPSDTPPRTPRGDEESAAEESDYEQKTNDDNTGGTSPTLSARSKHSIPSSRLSSPAFSPSLSRSSSPQPTRRTLEQEIESLLDDDDDSSAHPTLSPYSRQNLKNKYKQPNTPLEVARREIRLLREELEKVEEQKQELLEGQRALMKRNNEKITIIYDLLQQLLYQESIVNTLLEEKDKLKQIYSHVPKLVVPPISQEFEITPSTKVEELVQQRKTLEECAVQWVGTTLESSLSISKKLKLMHNAATAYQNIRKLHSEFTEKESSNAVPAPPFHPSAQGTNQDTPASQPRSEPPSRSQSAQSQNGSQPTPSQSETQSQQIIVSGPSAFEIARSCKEKTQRAIDIVDNNGGRPTNASDSLIAQLIQEEKLLQERKVYLLDLRERIKHQPLAIEYKKAKAASTTTSQTTTEAHQPPEQLHSPQPVNPSVAEFFPKSESATIELQIPPLPPIPQVSVFPQATPPPPPLPPSEENALPSVISSNASSPALSRAESPVTQFKFVEEPKDAGPCIGKEMRLGLQHNLIENLVVQKVELSRKLEVTQPPSPPPLRRSHRNTDTKS